MISTRQLLIERRQRTVAVSCALIVLIASMFALAHLERQLPGMPVDAKALEASQRYPVLPGESAWQQISMPVCEPTRITLPLAQPLLKPTTINAAYFVRSDADMWPDEPAAIVRTTLAPGQSELKLPFPDLVAAQRRLVRLQLTPTNEAIAFRAARDTSHELQQVTKRPGDLGSESLLFRAEYPGERWVAPVTCVISLQFPDVPPTVFVGAMLACCALVGWLCGVAWRLANPE